MVGFDPKTPQLIVGGVECGDGGVVAPGGEGADPLRITETGGAFGIRLEIGKAEPSDLLPGTTGLNRGYIRIREEARRYEHD
jgi:hypothetical protein